MARACAVTELRPPMEFWRCWRSGSVPGKVNVGGTVIEALRQTQRFDGSSANPENLVKEDDSLIATPVAISALVAGLEAR